MPLFSSGPSMDSVISRLGSTKDTGAHYVAISEYVESKKRKNKSTAGVAAKLDQLEEALARYSDRLASDTAPTFIRIRSDKGLPKSRLFPDAPISPTSGGEAPPAYSGHAPAPSISITAPSRSNTCSGGFSSLIAPTRSSVPRSGASSPAPLMVDGEEQLAMLRDFDTVFLVDDSGSMAGARWREARSAIEGVVHHAMKYDEDGVDIYFLNAKVVGKGLKRSREVEQLFAGVRPSGATPTGARLDKILKEYKKELDAAYKQGQRTGGDCYTVKPLNLVVITDGAPTDDPESALVSFAKYLDKYDFPLSQCGIQMFQIGNDPQATEALQDLDDALENRYDIRDIVDTVPYQGEMTADAIVKVLLGGINRRLDRKDVPR